MASSLRCVRLSAKHNVNHNKVSSFGGNIVLRRNVQFVSKSEGYRPYKSSNGMPKWSSIIIGGSIASFVLLTGSGMSLPCDWNLKPIGRDF